MRYFFEYRNSKPQYVQWICDYWQKLNKGDAFYIKMYDMINNSI